MLEVPGLFKSKRGYRVASVSTHRRTEGDDLSWNLHQSTQSLRRSENPLPHLSQFACHNSISRTWFLQTETYWKTPSLNSSPRPSWSTNVCCCRKRCRQRHQYSRFSLQIRRSVWQTASAEVNCQVVINSSRYATRITRRRQPDTQPRLTSRAGYAPEIYCLPLHRKRVCKTSNPYVQ